MELSKRLKAVADLVGHGLTVADIGTDHAYLPIYLIETGKCPFAIAMDIKPGPLKRAAGHIAAHGLSNRIKVRISDGVSALRANEAECVVLSGMGGHLVIRIMEEGEEIFTHLKEFVLQPQSEIALVRKYLVRNGYHIACEDMVCEDGKYYPMMKVVPGGSCAHKTLSGESQTYRTLPGESQTHRALPGESLTCNVLPDESYVYAEAEYRYGKILLNDKSQVLFSFLKKEAGMREKILRELEGKESESATARRKELLSDLEVIRDALRGYSKDN